MHTEGWVAALGNDELWQLGGRTGGGSWHAADES